MIGAIAFLVASRPMAPGHPRPARAPQHVAIEHHRAHSTPSPVRMDEIGITGGTTEYDGMAHTYTISGHVKVTLTNMAVTCDRAVIYASKSEQRVDKIEFLGDVIAVRDHNVFRGDDVTYFVATKRLLARGNTKTRIRMRQTGQTSSERTSTAHQRRNHP